MVGFAPTQNLAVCVGLNVLSGLLQVVGTMELAYPEYLETHHGRPIGGGDDKRRLWLKRLFLLGYIFIFSVAAAVNVVGSFFGPVSITVPAEYGSRVLFNMIAMGAVLRTKFFDKSQRTGTLIVFMSIMALPDVGPGVQEGQNAKALLSKPYAMVWSILLIITMVVSGIGMMFLGRTVSSKEAVGSATACNLIDNRSPEDHKNGSLPPGRDAAARREERVTFNSEVDLEKGRSVNKEEDHVEMPKVSPAQSRSKPIEPRKKSSYALCLLLAAAVSSAIIFNSTAKLISLVEGIVLGAFCLLITVCMAILVAAQVQSVAACDQALFVPLYVVINLTLNMITGLIVWEDWRVINTWLGYFSVFTLMILGVYQLTEFNLLDRFCRRKTSQAIRSSVLWPGKDPVSRNNQNVADAGASVSARKRLGRHSSQIAWSLVLTDGDIEFARSFLPRRSAHLFTEAQLGVLNEQDERMDE